MILLPLNNAQGDPLFEVTHDVLGVPLSFTFDWSEIAQRWRCEIRDAQGVILESALHVVANYALVFRGLRNGMPRGVFMFWREYGDDDPGRFDFDDTKVVLQFFTAEDFA